ncbi:MAG: putative methyltransferase [uncultured Solirubrobacteraceae bacterium]|uniref:Putative methyltransferase n=1 Tax=uncultured Solirubrobacteraceae bacterium TaxID=1162706 RepID=A0A6J4RI35_9ACTN|nr:MAG: putative methyltransferase [uncultured Solirubrobacteraceae bacterium]
MRLVTLPGVFAPISDSHMLADVLRQETLRPGSRVLDLCTGSGLLALTAAHRGVRDVTAVDVSRRSVLTVRLNARLNGVRVRALRGSLFEPVPGEAFDVITCNPPYVPAETDELPRRGPQRAWDAGRDGRVVLDRLLAEAPAHLRPGGRLLITHSSLLGIEPTRRALTAAGLEVDIPVRRRGPLGPLMSARVEHLEREGLLRPGQREEEVLVIRGRRPAADRVASRV